MKTTVFSIGDVVEANVTAQKMSKGQRYEVESFAQTRTPFGTFVYYDLRPLDRTLQTPRDVGNLHLLASKVSERSDMEVMS